LKAPKRPFSFAFEKIMSFPVMPSSQKLPGLGRPRGLFSGARFGIVLFVFCFSFSLLSSFCGKKKTDLTETKPALEAETLPDIHDRLIKIMNKEEALHNIGNGGLGIFSTEPDAHPDAREAPPTIMSPDPFFKARPQGPKEKLK
jgi:hypothetical protein